jgi:predicted RNA-binding Zn ribbon-like protein
MRLVTLAEVPSAEAQPLFVEFVNTLHWYAGAPIELIGNESDFAAWLLEHALPAVDVSGCLPEVYRLREHLRGITEALASQRALPPADMDALQAALSAPTGSLRIIEPENTQPHLGFATDAAVATVFKFQIALSVALFLRSPQRHRLKLCANPGCGFAFVDTSTNATRRWCFMRYCGNRVKVRAFRGRQRSDQRER